MNYEERLNSFDRTPLPIEIGEKSREWLINNGFFTAPASTKYHGAYEGGLFDHSLMVMNTLVTLTEQNGLIWERKVSPYIIGMFHDLCKTDQYRQTFGVTESGMTQYEYNTNTLLKGHGDKSVMIASMLTRLTEEEVLCIRYHMGAFTPKEEWNDYTGAVHKYPNVLWTHHADMIASHVYNT